MKAFKHRKEAGQQLAAKLTRFKNKQDVLVLALPRGGVPVAYEVASMLNVPFDVLIVRKLGTPGHREFAMGAIASDGSKVLNQDIINTLRIPQKMIDDVLVTEQQELERREQTYRSNAAPLDVSAKTIILIDDGVATGATMRAAIASLKQSQPKAIVVAVPSAARATYTELKSQVDDMICLATPEPYIAVGVWYQSFPQTSDDEVKLLLKRARSIRQLAQEQDNAAPTVFRFC